MAACRPANSPCTTPDGTSSLLQFGLGGPVARARPEAHDGTAFLAAIGSRLRERQTFGGVVALYCLDFAVMVDSAATFSLGSVEDVHRAAVTRLSVRFGTCLAFASDAEGRLLVLPRRCATCTEAEALGDSLVAAFEQPLTIGSGRCAARPRLGMAFIGQGRGEAAGLIRAAQIASVRQPPVRAWASSLSAARPGPPPPHAETIGAALAGKGFFLHYQPVVSAATDRVHSVEALLRWSDPRCAAVGTPELLHWAETHGMGDSLGTRILHRACLEARPWSAAVRLAVNISPLHLDGEDFARSVEAVIEQTGFPADRLDLEVTEGTEIPHTARVAATIARLRERGVRFLLDDFGSGHANLLALCRFAFDGLKIDRELMSRPQPDDTRGRLLAHVVGIGRDLGLTVTSEGIEREDQRVQAVAAGVDFLQGFLTARPMPADQMTAWLAAQRAPAAPTLWTVLRGRAGRSTRPAKA